MRIALKFGFFILSLMFFSVSAFAAVKGFEKSPWTDEPTYVEKSIHKLGFGLLNLSTGWDALFFEPTRNSNILKGMAKGIGLTITNTAGGALHAVTFPIPVDIPLPAGGIHFNEESVNEGNL